MKKEYIVNLSKEQRSYLKGLISKGAGKASVLMRARVLLKADLSQGRKLKDFEIADSVEVARSTVERLRKNFIEKGLEKTLNHNTPDRKHRRKVDGELEAKIIALACSECETQEKWSLRLLAEKSVEFQYVKSLSHTTVYKTLKKTNLNLT